MNATPAPAPAHVRWWNMAVKQTDWLLCRLFFAVRSQVLAYSALGFILSLNGTLVRKIY